MKGQTAPFMGGDDEQELTRECFCDRCYKCHRHIMRSNLKLGGYVGILANVLEQWVWDAQHSDPGQAKVDFKLARLSPENYPPLAITALALSMSTSEVLERLIERSRAVGNVFARCGGVGELTIEYE